MRFLLVALALLVSGQTFATTYYVRTDGGDASQCTGRADAAYPGSGTGKACAWKGPHYALPASGSPRIAGGDTLYIGPGEYMIGVNAPGANGGRCSASYPYDCFLAAVPSGPDSSHKTRIIGKSLTTTCALAAKTLGSRAPRALQPGCVAAVPGELAGAPGSINALVGSRTSKCPAPPKFWGTDRVSKVINLEGSSNVEIGCLEITDKSDCVEYHVNTAVRCQRDNPPYGQWASMGITAKASRNVWLHDLDIHGLANRGILAGGLTDWTVDRVKIVANGWAGWDGDIGTGSSNAGRILMRNVTIAWNGCGQRWQTGEIHACWAQESAGYGDGIGTAQTGGEWIIEDSYVHHNTSDGIDLLYLDGGANTSATIRRTLSVANAGNQIKTRGNALIENSVVVGQCSYFYNRYNMLSGDSCRAVGNALSLALANGQTTTVRHNTIIGEGDCLIISNGGNAASRVNIQNNALIGQLDWRSNLQGNAGELACGHYSDNSPAVVAYTGNDFYNVKSNQCPPGGNLCGQNPKLANMTMAAFDPTLLAGSPLIDKAPVISGVSLDYTLHRRPDGAGPDIGAIEKPSGAVTIKPHGAARVAALVQRDSQGSYRVDAANGSSAYGLSVGAAYRVAASGDYNGDGFGDVLWSNGRQLKFAINDGHGGFNVGAAVTYDSSWTFIGTADVDGDGRADLLLQRGTALSAWRMDGAQVIGSGSAGNVTAGYRLVDSGDLNADGSDDLAWSNGSTLAIWLNDGSGRFKAAWEGRYGGGWQPTALTDVDGDGSRDVVWQSGSQVAYWTMDGATPRAAHFLGDAGSGVKIVAASDSNGDGKADFTFSQGAATRQWMSNASGFVSSVDARRHAWTPNAAR